MARGEVTGRKPMVTADPPKRKPGPPSADPGAVEPTAHVEPERSASAPKPPIRGPPLAMSIREFCTAHRISEDMFFKMRRQGWGPAVMRVGTRTLISIEAAAEWRKAREQSACACGEFKASKTPPEDARREPPPGGTEFCDERR